MCSPRWRRSAAATLDLDAFRALDKERRELITATEQLKAQRNKASEEIARLKKEKQNADALIAEMKQVSEHIKQGDERIAQLDATQRELLLTIPNIPHSSVPVGAQRRGQCRGAPLGCAAEVRFCRPSLIGRLANARGFSIWPWPRKSPGRDLRYTKAGVRGWSGLWRISFSTSTPGNMATRRSCRRFW